MAQPRYTIIDADTHVTEPRDVWTARLPAKWKDRAPRVEWDAESGDEAWFMDGQKITSVGMTAIAGWPEPYPAHPPRYEDAHPGSYDAAARLRYMDGLGVWAQVLYPNVGGFGSQVFARVDDAELKLALVRAYNDFLIDWASTDRRRLIPIMATPFWDVDATVREIERCARLGHRGVLFTGEPQVHGLPLLATRHWDPLWAAAQDAGLSISFHIGSADFGDEFKGERAEIEGFAATSARGGARLFLQNGAHILDLLFSGILPRFPRLQFVSVESGAGWLPFVLQAADYQFEVCDVAKQRPEFELRPSEYFRRQVHACVWFENVASDYLLERVGVDNLMFETDFPHPTSIFAPDVHPTIERGMGKLVPEQRRRILFDNAARLYGIERPD
jgi:predicted TIM-barrel fold metal-dependent hydrolase